MNTATPFINYAFLCCGFLLVVPLLVVRVLERAGYNRPVRGEKEGEKE